jgi:hypothetical protein
MNRGVGKQINLTQISTSYPITTIIINYFPPLSLSPMCYSSHPYVLEEVEGPLLCLGTIRLL